MNHDPRITAYATGELEGRERETFEEKLAASDSLHREVESMSGLARELTSAARPTDRFTADERERLLIKCAAARRSRTVAKNSLKVVLWTTVGAAACLVVFAGFVGLVAMNSGSGPWANDAYYPGCENQAPGAQAAAAPAVVASERRPERVAVVERCERAARGARACIAAAV
jgi:anti-sigma factor RsiW